MFLNDFEIHKTSGKYIRVEIMNARCVLLKVNPEIFHAIKRDNLEDYEITEIEIDPGSLELKYKVGEEFTVKKHLFKLNKIKSVGIDHKGNLMYELLYSVMNNSMYFLTPLLFSTQEESLIRYMVNTFLSYKGEFEDMTMYLLYRHIPEKDKSLLFDKLRQPDSLLTIVEELIPDEYHTILKVKIHDSFKEVYETVMAGKYSELQEEIKAKILAFHKIDSNSGLYKALYKDPKFQKKLEDNLEVPYGTLDGKELWAGINFEKENYSAEYYTLSTSYEKWKAIT